MNILCMLGVECVANVSEASDAANKMSTVNAFIGISSLGISWLVTELYEILAPNSIKLQQLEKKAEELEDKLHMNLFDSEAKPK